MHTETDIDEIAQLTDPDKPGCSYGIRIGQDLIRATAPFAEEDVTKSWWHVGSTFSLMIAASLARRWCRGGLYVPSCPCSEHY